MRVLVGVDPVRPTEPEAAQWVTGLLGEEVPMEWFHVVPLPNMGLWAIEPMVAADMAERMAEQLASHAECALRRLAPESVSVRVRVGNPMVEILGRADDLAAELVAVEATQKSPMKAAWLGSVARALVDGAQQSVLVTRGSVPRHPLRVVVATDHSPYASRALSALVALQPKGIGQLTVVYAFPESGDPAGQAHARTEAVAQELGEALGLAPEQWHGRVESGVPFDVIEATLADTDADLLILGARGHGAWERLTLGSISHRAAHSGSRSTLILRV